MFFKKKNNDHKDDGITKIAALLIHAAKIDQNYSNKEMKEFNNMSIYEILHDQFRFLNPMNYETMIEKWQRECEKFNCSS